MTPVSPTPTRTRTPTRTPSKACGDVNDDGEVNSVDAALILQRVAGLIGSLVNAPSGDVNDDGSVNSVDAALILQLEAGMIDDLDCDGAGGAASGGGGALGGLFGAGRR
jgi:hypothetical protein